jgi:hypothetical protein
LLAASLGESETGATFRALIGNGHLDSAFGERFRSEYVGAQCRRNRGMLERGIERGLLPADLDVDVEADQLVGPLFYRALITREPLDKGFVDRLVDGFLARVRSRQS